MENLCGLFKNKKRKDWPEKINNNNNTNKLVVLKDPTGREIGIRYKLGTEIWRSESGITYHCNDRQTGEQLSYKWIYKKNKLRTAFDIENLRREVEIMRHLPDHPNIVSLKDTYEDDHHVHLVMELCQGGNLLDRIIGRGCYTEPSAASVVKSIVEVVQMCHEHGVMYRNLKLENCLFANKMDRGPLKVTDFRLSIFFKPGERLNQIVGNLYYMAPEVLKRNYGSEIDIWSAGVILYILLCGFPPFWAETEQGVSQAIIRSKIDFNREPWPKVSDNAKDLVKKMLDPDPKLRFTAQEVLDHPWLKLVKTEPDTEKDLLKYMLNTHDELGHPWLQNAKTVSKVSLGETVRAKLLQFSIMNQLTKTTSMVILKHLSTIEKVIEREISWVRDTGVKFSKIDDHEVRVRLHKLAQQIPHVDEQRLMNAVTTMLRTTVAPEHSTRITPSWLPHRNHSNSRITFINHHHKSLVKCSKMTVTPRISVNDSNLMVHGKTILSEVPDNIVLTPGTGKDIVTGAFIGATASNTKSLHVFPIGVLQDLRFLCCFRFKLWWMTHRVGTCGRDIPLETQFMLIETRESRNQQQNSPVIYTVLLPLLEGQFRAVLQGNHKNEIEICLESGDPSVETNQGLHLVYMHTGTNPFEVINQAVKAVEKQMQTFLHREKKRLPSFLDWFGWCTWDAFYTDVTAEGIEEGLKSLSEGGTSPRFLIIDDGWQQIESKPKDADCAVQEGAQFATRLTGIKENTKFQKNGESNGLKHVVDQTKQRHNVKHVYVWHALAGYWGGVKPAAIGMEHYETSLAYPIHSPGVLGNQPDVVMDSLAVHGLGLVHPKKVFDFYNELHAYLTSCGVDGVKVDVQNIIETLGSGHGGRVSITRSYHQALEASIARNFRDNGCIACMCHNTDGLYSAKQTAVVRASDDFYPHDPASHTIHVSSVAYNSIFLGEFMQPDWDMFHSLHPAAEYHAAARAISGGPIYVSDKPGRHNFDLLKKLVLPDGSVLRAQLPARPTLDSLFVDPARDGNSLLKIWNLNKCSGVVGVFNCQGAGWCKIEKKNRIHCETPGTLSGSVCTSDVDLIAQVAGADWNGDAVVYAYKSGELIRLPTGASLPVTLKVLEYELLHFYPIKEIAQGISFAPIGLLDMFNTGGAVEYFEIHKASEVHDGGFSSNNSEKAITAFVSLRVRGSGRFGVYSSQRPSKCVVDDNETEFNYESESGLTTFYIPVPVKDMYIWSIEIHV